MAFIDAGPPFRSPSRQPFAIADRDGDGVADLPPKPKTKRDDNFRVHADSAQISFFDDQVERVHSRKLRAYDSNGNLTHPYRYPE
jgi:hypothetical protein